MRKNNDLVRRNRVSKKQIEEKNKMFRRKYLRRVFLQFVFLSFTVSGFVFWVENLIPKPAYFEPARKEERRIGVNYSAVIWRAEHIEYGDTKGDFERNFKEGSKVKANDIVGRLYFERNALEEGETRSLSGGSLQQEDLNINKKTSDFFSFFYSKEESQDTRPLVVSAMRRGSQHKEVRAKESGVLSFIVGVDKQISKETAMKMSYTTYTDFFIRVNQENAFEERESSKKEPLFKIVTDDEWGVIVFVEKEEGVDYEVNQTYDVSTSKMKIPMKLIDKKEEGSKVRLVFSTIEYINHFMSFQALEIQLNQLDKEGLIVPLEAIFERNKFKVPLSFIVRQRNFHVVNRISADGMGIESVKVNFLKKGEEDGEEFGYIQWDLRSGDGLRLNDRLVSEENYYDLNDFSTEKGVYVINGRTCKFENVEILYEWENEVLLEEKKSGVKQGDNILVNPSTFRDGELLTNARLLTK